MKVRALVALLSVVLLLPLLLRAELTDDVLRLLPEDAGIRSSLEILDRFGGGDVLLFEIDGRGAPSDALQTAVDQLEASLSALPHVDRVHAGMDLAEAAEIRGRLTPHTAAFVPEAQLASRTSEDGIRAALSMQLARLSGPGGALAEATLIRDPLALEEAALRALASGAPGVRAVGGLLQLAPDTALVIADLDRSPARVGPDDPMVSSIRDVVARQPLPVTWYGGHRVASDTARAVRADVHTAATLGMVGLALVILVGFRTLRPLVGAIGPLAFTAVFLVAGAGLVSPLHGIQVGFVSVIGGLAVDYWIHLYVAASQHDPGTGRAGRIAAVTEALRQIRVPLLLSNASSVLVFALLTRSDVPIVRDLGYTGAFALVGALLGTVLVGPFAYTILGRPSTAPRRWPVRPRLAAGILATIALLSTFSPGARFDGDPSALLATSAEARRLEAYYDREGLTGDRGIALITGAPETITDRAARLEAALGQQGYATPIGPAAVMPGAAARTARRDALPSVDVLQARLDRAAQELGFAPFEGAAERIHASLGPVPRDLWAGTLLQARVDRYLREDAAMISVALVDPSVGPALKDVVAAVDPRALWITPHTAARGGVTAASGDLVRSGAIGIGLVFLVLLLRYRDPGKAVLAMLPVAAAVATATGGVAILDEPWNPVSLGVLVLAVGLALDYGVFMVESPEDHTRRAVVLGAATTISATASLWLAASPALRSVGIVLTLGILAAVGVAALVVPALQAPTAGLRRAGRIALGLAAAALWFVQADVLLNLWGTAPRTIAVGPAPEVDGDGRTWTTGPNRRTWAQGVWLIETRGSPYASGLAMGALTRDLRGRLEEELLDSFAQQVPYAAARWIITRTSLVLGKSLPARIRPEYLAEIQGVVDSTPDPYWLMGSAYTRRIFYHAIHDLGQAFVDTPLVGCTGFVAGGAATSDGHWILARNFDFEGGVAFDRDKVVWVHQPDAGFDFLSVSFAGMVGAVSGVNEEGLAVIINASGSADPIRPGTPMTLIIREILQYASSLDEAHAILEARRGFVSENVLVVDGDAGEAALFEVTPDRLATVPVDDWLAVSNHFRSDLLADDPVNLDRMTRITTVPRLARMEELVAREQGRLDLPTAAALLADRRGLGDAPLPPGHRHAIDADIATHAVVIDATTRTVWVSRFPNLSGGMVRFSLGEILAGDPQITEVVPARADAALSVQLRAGRDLLRAARGASGPEALDMAKAALHRMPGHPEALFEVGRLIHAQGDVDAARPLLERALAAPPEYIHQREAIEGLLERP